MSWPDDIAQAIRYMEDHLTDEVTVEEIAKKVHLSPFYFQRGFSLLCGITVSEYLRNRRLSLAGRDLRMNGDKVLDVALRYGYDSPDSFAKAFTRFHGISPSQAKNGEGKLKNYLPLRIHLSMKGGFEMECKIVKKPSFTVIGCSRVFKNEEGYEQCPKFWDELLEQGDDRAIGGTYGLCFDSPTGETFRYMIADDYVPSRKLSGEWETEVIPESTWAVFPSRGPLPQALQEVNTRIFSEWLPQNTDYEISGRCSVEYYTDPADFPKGNGDENYYCEIWMPVKAKEK